MAGDRRAQVAVTPPAPAGPPPSGGRLWQNGRCARSYDEIGPCLGSGGMGSVWAARVREGADSSGCTGSWVAVKAIPVDLAGGTCEISSVQSGLRECLSTFRDLSPAHVVCYENYWLEEPAHLPPEVQRFCERRLPSAAPRPPPPRGSRGGGAGECSPPEALLVDSGIAWTSRRFQETADGHELRWSVVSSSTPPKDYCTTPSGFNDSCAFVWEEAEKAVDEAAESDCPGADESPPSGAPSPRHGTTPQRRSRLAPPEAPQRHARCVVLLIEMELMGLSPDARCVAATEERLTLRAWLQRQDRTFSDAADVFGSLILSVRHIHRKRIVHADLKPDNIFCETCARREGRGAERSRVTAVRIGDFGLACENNMFRRSLPGYTASQPRTLGGTPGYCAPEISRGEVSDKADIFACAVILLELLLQPPGTQMEWAKVSEKFHSEKVMPEFISSRLPKTRALLLEMGAQDPAARLSAEEACKRFEKEVRKELCRSSAARCCSPRLGGSPSTPPLRCSDPADQPALEGFPESAPPAPAGSRGGNRRGPPPPRGKGARKGRRR